MFESGRRQQTSQTQKYFESGIWNKTGLRQKKNKSKAKVLGERSISKTQMPKSNRHFVLNVSCLKVVEAWMLGWQ